MINFENKPISIKVYSTILLIGRVFVNVLKWYSWDKSVLQHAN